MAWKQGASNAGMPANLLLTDAQLKYMVILCPFGCLTGHFSAYFRHWPSLGNWHSLKHVEARGVNC